MSTEEVLKRYGVIFGKNEVGIKEYVDRQINISIWPMNFTLKQYAEMFQYNKQYIYKMCNTWRYAFIISIGQVAISSMVAYGISFMKNRHRYIIILVYILLVLLPCQVMIFPNYYIMNVLGLLNKRISILLLGIFSPLSVFFVERQIRRLPDEIRQAAALDGAGEIRFFFFIILPFCKSTLISCSLISFIDCMNMIEYPMWLLKDADALEPFAVSVGQLDLNLLPTFFAMLCIFMLPSFIVYFIGVREIDKGLT